MICPNCNNELQDGVAFCKYCGASLKDYKPEAEEKTVIIPDETDVVVPAEEPVYVPEEAPEYIPAEEAAYIPPEEPAYIPPEEPAYAAYEVAKDEAPKKKGKAGKVVGIVVGALLLLAAIGFGVWMMLQKNEAEDKLEAKEKSLQSIQSELDSTKEELASAMEELEECGDYETYVDAIDSICEFANYSSCGYASDLFHVDQGIIVLEEGDDYKTITLTTAFEGGGTYDCYVDYGTGAYAEFDEDEWSGDTTTISVVRDDYDLEDGEIGVTVINFTNDINNQSFSILVITVN